MKLLYRPLGLIVGIIAGRIATSLFSRVWERLAEEPEVPKPTAHDRSWAEVVIAGTLKGAIFGGTRAAVNRGGASAYSFLTGVWPGPEQTKNESGAGRR